MADIRINALATTAASTASDDFIAVDGSANGTRKLNAYSPTFGGNLTVSGTAVSTSTTTGSGVFGGGLGVAGTIYAGGNVRIANSFFFSGKNAAGTVDVPIVKVNASDQLEFGSGGYTALFTGNLTVSGGTVTSGTGTLTLNSSANTVVLQSAGTTALTLDSSQNATFAGKITANGAGSTFKGTTTNDNAATGYVGEYVESVLSFSGRTTLTNATGKSVTSVSLTAGDWDLFGFVGHDGASATTTYVMGSFSTTNDTSNSTDYSFSPLIFTTSNFNNLMSVPTLRVSLSGTTTIYLVAESGFSAGTLKAWGRISARRVR